jgi:hypothetical protein
MHRNAVPFLASLACCLLLLAFAAPATAASQHTVTVEWVFTGANCPLSTVVVSASSCDGEDIADELVDEMLSGGFSGAFCGYSVNEQWECLASFSSYCTMVDTTLSVKPGLNCTYDYVKGQNNGPIGSYLVFMFDVP